MSFGTIPSGKQSAYDRLIWKYILASPTNRTIRLPNDDEDDDDDDDDDDDHHPHRHHHYDWVYSIESLLLKKNTPPSRCYFSSPFFWTYKISSYPNFSGRVLLLGFKSSHHTVTVRDHDAPLQCPNLGARKHYKLGSFCRRNPTEFGFMQLFKSSIDSALTLAVLVFRYY